jgi:hypothetical protein
MGLASELSEITGRLRARARDRLVSRAQSRLAIGDDARRNISSLLKLYGPAGEGGFPTELVPVGASMWSGFMFTPFAQQQMEGWVLPFWLRRQTLPSSESFIPHSHVWFYSNAAHRNWTGIGLCGYRNEGMVDPRGLVTPWPWGPSVDAWILSGTELICPSELDSVEQRLIDDRPLVETRFDAAGLSCTWTTFVAQLEGIPVVLSIVEVANRKEDPSEAALVLSVRPYHNESMRAVNNIRYFPGDRCFKTDGDLLVYLADEPDQVLLSDYIHGDVALQLREPERERLPASALEVDEPFGLATGAAVYRRSIEPGGALEVVFACPMTAGIRPSFARMLPEGRSLETAREGLAEQRLYWSELAGEGMSIEVPDERYSKAFDVNKTFLLLLYDGQAITPGVSTYHMMWFRDAAYLVPALERMGHADKARSILVTYEDRQTPEGFFRSHNAEWDSNGQAIWTLVNHYRMTGDRDFLTQVYPSIFKGARWIDDLRQKGLPVDDPRHGLMPAGISAEHFGINDCYYWDDLWSVAGLRAAALAARELGRESDASYLVGVASEMWRSLEASWRAVARRLGREVMPIAPSRDVDAASVGTVAAVYPLDLMPPERPLIANTVAEIVRKCFYRDTHYHGIMHCGINPYLSLHVAQYYLRLRDPYALTIFESLWSMRTSTNTYPEAINPLTGGGSYGDGHDGWAAGDIFNFVRNLFVLEEGDRLALLPLPRADWFDEGARIEVKCAPTYFGEISYTAEAGRDRAEYELSAAFVHRPESIELGTPFPVVSCKADGRSIDVVEGATSVKVPADAKRVLVEVERRPAVHFESR